MKRMNLKSEGEKEIAEFLKKRKIKFTYEKPILIQDHAEEKEKLKIWYPDFYLDDFNIVIEYFGMIIKRDYIAAMKKKQAVYHGNKIDFISIYPEDLKNQEQFQKMLWDKIRNILQYKLKILGFHREMYFRERVRTQERIPNKIMNNKRTRKNESDDFFTQQLKDV